MSYDLQVWSIESPRFPEAFPDAPRWTGDESCRVYSGIRWQISVGRADDVLPEDVPEEVQQMLAGIRFCTELNRSLFDAGPGGRRYLLRAA